MKTAFLETVDMSCRKQRVRLLILTCLGIVSFCLAAWVLIPAICPANRGPRTSFSAGKFIANAATTAGRGLHYGTVTGPFDRTHCVYLGLGSNIWFVEARTALEQ